MRLEDLLTEMRNLLGQDQKRIDHALAVLDYAQRLQEKEGGDILVIQAAALLHDIGIHEAEKKYGSAAGKYQEIEGPPIAQSILARYNLKRETMEHICRIIANHHSTKDIDTTEFRCIWDADWLVTFPEDFAASSREVKQKKIAIIFKTPTGKYLAEKMFL